MRGPDPLGHLQLGVEHVDADDLPGAADPGALDDRQPDAAASEHRDGLPGLEPRRAQRGSDAGEDAAAHERGPVERQRGIDLHHRVLVQQHALGVAADADELAERLASLREPRLPRLRARDDAADAEVRMARQALGAAPTEAGQARDHVIAGPQRGDVGADRFDDARALVAQHVRSIERKSSEAVDDVEVAVTDAGGGGADQDLAAPRLVDLHGFDRERLVHLAEDCGLHLHTVLLIERRSAYRAGSSSG